MGVDDNRDRFMQYGKKVEKDFFAILTRQKNVVSFSSQNEDRLEHWDLMCNGVRIDVKAMKKISRYDMSPNENYHHVETRNVNGALGWLYGAADEFAFETEDYFVIVTKERLQKMMEVKCGDMKTCTSPTAYKAYQREGRIDCTVLVKTIDLIIIAKQILIK